MDTSVALMLLALFTSTITAITGVGGGMVLVAVLSSFLAPSILIPVHGATQLSSNILRAIVGCKEITCCYENSCYSFCG